MKEFIMQNFTSLIAALIGVINLLIILIKKRVKVVDGVWAQVLAMLPDCILSVERVYHDGPEKKALVLNYCLDYISTTLDLSRKQVELSYGSKLSDALEMILACPQKKGVSIDEK